MSTRQTKARAIAFYLPQFHPIPENDEWWEKGFTEWTNVTKAKPLFEGHHQPDLPSDLGFYDLRVPEVREQQARLAQDHGIEGFAYWHYWFGNGKRILDKVFEEVLKSGKPDFPFCLAWANMTWSGIWHGLENKILIEQKYPGLEDHEAHFNLVLPAFRDHRYIKVDGKPLFIIYKPEDLPDSETVLPFWRELARRNGFPDLYFVGIFWDVHHASVPLYDAITPCEPAFFKTYGREHLRKSQPPSVLDKVRRRILRKLGISQQTKSPGPDIVEYDAYVDGFLTNPQARECQIPCVMPNWDNTPRSGRRGTVFRGANPEAFRKVLQQALAAIRDRPEEERLLIIKSWNEWAEGNYLEPSRRFGLGYLKCLKEEIVD